MTVAAIEYRPALFQAFGIGRYVKNLAPALLEADPSLRLKLFSVFLRGHAARERAHAWPPGRAERVGMRLPGRLVPLLGSLGWRVDARLMPFDLFHHTDYAITPLRTKKRVVTLYDTAWRGDREWVEPCQSRRMEGAVRALVAGDPEIITLSAFARSELVGYLGLAPDRVHVTPLAADPVFFERQDPAVIAEVQRRHEVRAPYVVALGTLEPRKNVETLVAAMGEVRPKARDLSLLLLGRKGFRHERVFAAIEDLEARGVPRGFARWLGSVPDEDAAALVQGAAAVVFPSLYEGFGLPAIEGMAAGVPVIASDIPVMREVCGDAALLVDTIRPAALAEAISWAGGGGSGADAIAARGRARAATFTWRRCAEGTLAAYRRLLERTS